MSPASIPSEADRSDAEAASSQKTYVVATDEAGYGPKLGPLIVVSTIWSVPGNPTSADELEKPFSALMEPIDFGSCQIAINDSKQVFRQGEGLTALHAVTSAALQWIDPRDHHYPACLASICPENAEQLAKTPWLSCEHDIAMLNHDEVAPLIDHWSRRRVELVHMEARVLTAATFNDSIERGLNKADLLSTTTLGLIAHQVDHLCAPGRAWQVFCDRHGGRKFYAAPLQHSFPDWMIRVESERSDESRYRLCADNGEINVRFTVKGDRFAPVAFSSLVAKYLRERFMHSFNDYFRSQVAGDDLKPTAGYPVDADRFLRDIEPIRMRNRIQDHDLIRLR